MADKLATAFTPITNPAGTRLIMIADEATGERYRISIADFFDLVDSGADFNGSLSTNIRFSAGGPFNGTGEIQAVNLAAAPYISLNREGNKFWGMSVASAGKIAFQYGDTYANMLIAPAPFGIDGVTGDISMPNMRTTPGPTGTLWNDNGTVKVSG